MKEVNLETDQSVLYKLGSKNRIKNGMYNHQQFDTTVDKSDSYRCTKKTNISIRGATLCHLPYFKCD